MNLHTCTSLLQMILHIFKPHRMCCRSEEVDRFALNKLMNHIVFVFWVPRNLNILIHNELFLIDICQIHSGVWELGVSFRTRSCVSSLLPCVFFFVFFTEVIFLFHLKLILGSFVCWAPILIYILRFYLLITLSDLELLKFK